MNFRTPTSHDRARRQKLVGDAFETYLDERSVGKSLAAELASVFVEPRVNAAKEIELLSSLAESLPSSGLA